ncbi:DUF3577 domain-containing protein [Cardiobacterium valvarum]|uniref:Protein of uncharacterized function (DUF3577) n=1 Tax=Cardiobacterium valvarum TaxID=194702 RepID=A0A381E825_9GAMM|nr:DUF3577 domain-containing protein [Cardiobacterium valvarum]SUX22925.1 Protein of uncharacterised function (DUF3577) [Cardiobacterium valvarum]
MNQNNFFDFTADAVAFINEIKIHCSEKSKKGRFIGIKAAILEGENGENKVFCDLIVRGQQALQVLEHLQQGWPQGNGGDPNWLAGLRIGSLYAKAYTSRKGEAKAVLGGRLLAIKWLKVDGERIEVPEWRSDTTIEEEQPQRRSQPQQPRNQPQPQRQPQTPPQREDQGKSQDWQQQSQRRPQHPPQGGYQGQPQRHQRQQYQPARSQNPQRSRYQEEQSQFA